MLAEAADTIHDRQGDMHDTHGRRLVDKTTNQTAYQFGYLYFADTLCYWNRELAQVKNLTGDTSIIPPACCNDGKLGLGEPDRARRGSVRLEPASRACLASSTKSRAEPSQLARAREPAREPRPTVNNVSAAQ